MLSEAWRMELGSPRSLKGWRHGLACSGRSSGGRGGGGRWLLGLDSHSLWNVPQEQAWLWEGLRVGWTARGPGQARASPASTRWAAYVRG